MGGAWSSKIDGSLYGVVIPQGVHLTLLKWENVIAIATMIPFSGSGAHREVKRVMMIY